MSFFEEEEEGEDDANNNYCVQCGMNMGYENNRQLCGKTFCYELCKVLNQGNDRKVFLFFVPIRFDSNGFKIDIQSKQKTHPISEIDEPCILKIESNEFLKLLQMDSNDEI